MKLQIGSGKNTAGAKQSGWVTLDPDPAVCADIIATVPPLPPEVGTERWEHIEMIHVLEHLYLHDARQLLRELHAVLMPGGRLVIEVPDIKQAARYLLGILPKEPKKGSDMRFWDMFAFYGDQNGNPFYQHLWGYWPESLSAECSEAGFDTVNVKPAVNHWPWRDFRVEAIKEV